MRLLRTIRLDPSDGFVFDIAAAEGEWAVSGAFRFWEADPATLGGKARAAFRGGLLGIASFGWSTLAQVVDADAAARAEAVEQLARALVEHCGAPGLDAARPAAEEEIAFAAGLADHPAGTLVAVHRTHEDGAIREAFRTLEPRPGAKPLDVFAFMQAEDAPEEHVDLARVGRP